MAAREGLRSGIEVSDDGVTVVSFARRRLVRWDQVAGFETARRGTESRLEQLVGHMSSMTVVVLQLASSACSL